MKTEGLCQDPHLDIPLLDLGELKEWAKIGWSFNGCLLQLLYTLPI